MGTENWNMIPHVPTGCRVPMKHTAVATRGYWMRSDVTDCNKSARETEARTASARLIIKYNKEPAMHLNYCI